MTISPVGLWSVTKTIQDFPGVTWACFLGKLAGTSSEVNQQLPRVFSGFSSGALSFHILFFFTSPVAFLAKVCASVECRAGRCGVLERGLLWKENAGHGLPVFVR